MKTVMLLWVLTLAFTQSLEAQITNNYKTVLVTNWVKPGPYLRVVDGVTYNVAYSKNWAQFSAWEDLGVEHLDPGEGFTKTHFVLGNYQIISNVTYITVQKQQMQYNRNNPGDPPDAYPAQDDHVVAVLHCEDPRKYDFYCTRTKDVLDAKGVAFRAYDCGVQATNLVAVVKKNKVPNP